MNLLFVLKPPTTSDIPEQIVINLEIHNMFQNCGIT